MYVIFIAKLFLKTNFGKQQSLPKTDALIKYDILIWWDYIAIQVKKLNFYLPAYIGLKKCPMKKDTLQNNIYWLYSNG